MSAYAKSVTKEQTKDYADRYFKFWQEAKAENATLKAEIRNHENLSNDRQAIIDKYRAALIRIQNIPVLFMTPKEIGGIIRDILGEALR